MIHDDFGKNGLIFSYTPSLKDIRAGTQERNLEAENETGKNGGVLLTDLVSVACLAFLTVRKVTS